MRYRLLLLASLLALFSCERKDIDVEPAEVSEPFELIADLGQTKTINKGMDTVWAEDDSVHVYHKPAGSSSYIDDGRFLIKDAATGTFVGRLASKLEYGQDYDWKMVYPYTKDGSVAYGELWQSQQGNGSSAHLRGSACPLEGTLEALPAGNRPKVQMHNLASVAVVSVTNANSYDMTVNTVKVGDYTLQIKGGESLRNGEKADFYIPVKPSAAGNVKVAVDGYEKTLSANNGFRAGYMERFDFSYDNKDKTIVDATVWQSNRYSSFTDIVYFGRKYYCAFREAGSHVVSTYAERGKIVIRSSTDCVNWETELEFSNDFDLRDPHFVISNDGQQLFVYYGMMAPIGEDGYFPRPYCSGMTVLALNAAGKMEVVSMNSVEMKKGTEDKSYYWLWGLTKHDGSYYGVAYYIISNGEGYPIFVRSEDGIHFTEVATVNIKGNEASPIFVGERAYIFFRSVEKPDAIVTYADPPYSRWTRNVTTYEGLQMHCPIAVNLWGKIYVCMRGNTHGVPIYAYDPDTKEFKFVHDVFANTYTDRAYPGMIVQDDCMHVVYYAYKSVAQNIYYQRIPLAALDEMTRAAFGN